jgi:1-acyl-sn-glycerol-3-phosphate acyltransferase
MENLPKNSGYVICSNHKSNYEPMVLGALLPGYVRYMAKNELWNFKPFGCLISHLGAIPIKRGKGDVRAVKETELVLQNGGILVIFPEGHRNKIFDENAGKPGAAKIAYKMKVPIVPVGISGGNVKIGKPIIPNNDSNAATNHIMHEIRCLL